MRRAVVVVAISAATLAGCGGGSGSGSNPSVAPTLNGLETRVPKQVLQSATNGLRDASAVHVAGTLVSGGQSNQLDLQLQGNDIQGSETIKGQKIDIVSTGGAAYVRAPAAFWTANGAAAVAKQLDNKFVRVPPSAAKSINQISQQSLANQLAAASPTLQPGVTRSDVDGRPAVFITQQDGSQLFVANTGDPVPLRIQNNGATPGTVNFTGYNQVQPITAPPGAITLPTS
jgi:hypothetical protein